MPGRPARRAGSVLLSLLLVLVVAPSLAPAQRGAAAWTLGAGRAEQRVAEVTMHGYAAVPVSALIAVGLEVASGSGQVAVSYGESSARLRLGSFFYTLDGHGRELAHPVYAHGGVVYVPIEFLTDVVPELTGGGVTADATARTLRWSGGAEPVENRGSSAALLALGADLPADSGSKARRLVVIDAGHGGVDHGAKGPSGLKEKDVALAVARRLATLLREDANLEVRMTRDRDTLIALRERARLANRWRGDNGRDALFISIHTNAHESRSARGFETYFLSEAKTEEARRVAEMENAAQRYETDQPKLDPMSFILHDLRQNKYLRDSSDWAAMIQRRMGAVHSGPNRGVKQAGFVVLDGVFMPAVLVELGFITHPQEERFLADVEQQARFARQLAAAVHDFFGRSAATAATR